MINTAAEYGIEKKDLIVDALTMTISTDIHNAIETLKAVKYIKKRCFGVHTVLGVSNISFGLPKEKLLILLSLRLRFKAVFRQVL